MEQLMKHSNPEVDLPICTNMTHILFHYGKLPADRWSKGFFNFLVATFFLIKQGALGQVLAKVPCRVLGWPVMGSTL